MCRVGQRDGKTEQNAEREGPRAELDMIYVRI